MNPNKEFMIDFRDGREILGEVLGKEPSELNLMTKVRTGIVLLAIIKAQNEMLHSANAALARQLNKTPTNGTK